MKRFEVPSTESNSLQQFIFRFRLILFRNLPNILDNKRIRYDLIDIRPSRRLNLKTHSNNLLEVIRIAPRNPLKDPPLHLSIQPLKVTSLKRRLECGHLIQHTSKRPHIALAIIGLISPYFGGGVVGGAGLSMGEAFFHDL